MKRETIIFKLVGLFLLMALLGFMLSCEKTPFEIEQYEFEKEIYQGTCKIDILNSGGYPTGTVRMIATDSLNYYDIDSAINNCTTLGGNFILNNDSNGVMCYKCVIQKWFPE